MDLDTFHMLIDTFANEGGVEDLRIPTVVRQSALFLERNYNFQYMRAEILVTFSTAEDPAAQSLGKFVKAIVSGEAREVGSTAGIKPFAITDDAHAQLDDQEFEGKLPVLRFQDSNGETWVKPLLALSGDIDGHFVVVKRTDWPTSSFSDYTHPLLDKAEDVLMAASMLRLASVTKDPELRDFYQNQYAEGLKTLLDSDFAFSIEEM